MGSLSNFLRRPDAANAGRADPPPAECRTARPDEILPALRLILGSGGRAADQQQLVEFLAFARQRGIDLSELWIALAGGTMAWAVLPIPSAGRTMLVFTPNDPPHALARPAIEVLLDALCDRFARRNVQLAQALLDPADDASRCIFEARRFERMAELIYLHAPISRPLPQAPLPPHFFLAHYCEQTHALFAAAIISSYRQSLDCPRLNGVRGIDDIIAGHKASGQFDRKHWFVLCQHDPASGNDVPYGVLLLSRLPRGDCAELVYLGLSTQARGQRLGDWLMRQAFATCAEMGVGRLSLAVDSTNASALKLYYRFGMSRMGSKVAMMRKLC